MALPVLLCAVRATTGILRGIPQADWLFWVALLGVVNVIYGVLAWVLYDAVVEE